MGILCVIGGPVFVGSEEEIWRGYDDWVIDEAGRNPDNEPLRIQAAEIRLRRHFSKAEELKSGLKNLGTRIHDAQRRWEAVKAEPCSGFTNLNM